jgi:hypothetical protein
MLIGSKLPPEHINKTFFNSGRAAFAFLVENIIKPKKVYLPTFTCWSLVSTMEKRFPNIEVEFYPVGRDLSCVYPSFVGKLELLVYIHYFGYENKTPLPQSAGTILEDISHSYISKLQHKGDFVFGSYRKILKVGDGGFINAYFNPIYEKSRKLDTWLRYEAKDWRDVREAENMTDRDWQIADISGQSLAILLKANLDLIRSKRRANERFLTENITVGQPLLAYRPNECPLLHNRLLQTQEERDSLRTFLAKKGIFTSIHWPTHEVVLKSGKDIGATLWLEDHIISIPVSHDYNLNDMEYIADCIHQWQKG